MHLHRYLTRIGLTALVAVWSFEAAFTQATTSGRVASHPLTEVQSLTETDRGAAESRLPVLTDRSLLPAEVLEALDQPAGLVAPSGFGVSSHPFTTKRAGARGNTILPVNKYPWRSTGKLWMRDGNRWFVCTASIIKKGIVVTAAHCVHDFGESEAGFVDQVIFEPARHRGNSRCTPSTCPFGEWNGVDIFVPQVYVDGSDVCTAPGVVCENDVALVVLDTLNGEYVQQGVGGRYKFRSDEFGFSNFLGQRAAQVTQLGYPVAHDGGYRMIRTDSLGYQSFPNNLVIGSDQTGGSSGGPWLLNFGIDTSSSSSEPSDNDANAVVATTSWGFSDSTLKLQGASRFARNSAFPNRSNIQTLVNQACSAYPSHC